MPDFTEDGAHLVATMEPGVTAATVIDRGHPGLQSEARLYFWSDGLVTWTAER